MIRRIVKVIFIKIKYLIMYASIRASKRKKFFIFVSPNDNCNVGDLAILSSERNFINDYFPEYKIVEINNNEIEYGWNLERLCKHDDIIAVNGGGFLGTLWLDEELNTEKIISTYQNRRIYVFPQTIYYDIDEKSHRILINAKKVYEKNEGLVVFVREKMSKKIGDVYFPNTKIIESPDMVFYSNFNILDENRCGVLICLRNDCEKVGDYLVETIKLMEKHNYSFEITDMLDLNRVRSKNNKIRRKLRQFAKSQLVITDRLHAMVFCVLTGTPCLVLDSKSHKIQGTYEWIERYKYIKILENNEDFEEEIQKMMGIEYTEKYSREEYSEYFEEMARIIRNE